MRKTCLSLSLTYIYFIDSLVWNQYLISPVTPSPAWWYQDGCPPHPTWALITCVSQNLMQMPPQTTWALDTLLWSTKPPPTDISVQPYLLVLGLNYLERWEGWEKGRHGGLKSLTQTHNLDTYYNPCSWLGLTNEIQINNWDLVQYFSVYKSFTWIFNFFSCSVNFSKI